MLGLSESIVSNNQLLGIILGSQLLVAVVNYFAQKSKILLEKEQSTTDEWRALYEGAKKDIKEKSDIIKTLQMQNQEQAKEINKLWARIQDRQ